MEVNLRLPNDASPKQWSSLTSPPPKKTTTNTTPSIRVRKEDSPYKYFLD